MGPPFVLEQYNPERKRFREQRLIYTKNKYNSKVKVHDWQHIRVPTYPHPYEALGSLKDKEQKPILSECLCDKYQTTYKTVTEQLRLKDVDDHSNDHKDLFNYYGYTDDKIDANQFTNRNNFPIIMKNDHNLCPEFITTMQDSYTTPMGMIMQRLRSPEERFMLYRRLKGAEDSRVNTKFRDDRMEEVNCLMRRARKSRYVSYNPITGLNSDGTIPKT